MGAPSFLFLYTEAPTRAVLAGARPGRMILASDVIDDEDRAVYDACVALPPPDRFDEVVRVLEGVLDRMDVDRIVAQAEYGLLPGAFLAARRGEPGPSLDAAHACTNKWLCRRRLEAAGVPIPRYVLAASAADVRRAALRYPVVLKPVASCLGRHVLQVARPEDLDVRVTELLRALPRALDVLRLVAFARAAGIDVGCDPTRQFLVEEYAEGVPLEVDGLVHGRTIDLFGVTEQVVSPPPRFYMEGYLFPTDRASGVALSARRALEAVGLTDSGFSIEFRGETLIEVNGRLGEDEGFPDLFHRGLGRYPILEALSPTRGVARPPGRHAVAYLNRYEGGRVARAFAPSGVTLLVRPGTTITELGTADFSPHLAYAIASHPSDSRAAYEEARARLAGVRVEFE